MTLLSAVLPIFNNNQLRHDKQAATIKRLAASRHVADLRLLFSSTFWVAFVFGGIALWLDDLHETSSPDWFQARDCAPSIGAIAAVDGAAWPGLTRLAGAVGVVDLFA